MKAVDPKSRAPMRADPPSSVEDAMKHIGAVAVSLLVAMLVTPVMAHEGHMMPAAKATKASVTGEVVDMGCYLGHAARGEKHISCATKCLSQGMPMGLLTSNGTLYLVTLDHDNADPYNSMKNMAGKDVTVTGAVLARNGVKAIEATTVKPAGK
jgi:hypothetical protein